MKEILYIEVPTPDTTTVVEWLHQDFDPSIGLKILTPSGFRVRFSTSDTDADAPTTSLTASISEKLQKNYPELSVFVWSLQRTTYLKVFRWAEHSISQEKQVLQQLVTAIRDRFPNQYPEPPQIDLSKQTIFAALADRYPLTVKYFQKMPNGEYDLTRVYWWEQRWREGVRNPQQPKQVVFKRKEEGGRIKDEKNPSSLSSHPSSFDLIYIGGALGVIHAAVMARLGYKVLLLERLPFGRMNREWNISRSEFQSLINLGLFTAAEFEELIAREYQDGFHKFFDANNPAVAKAPVLHTPRVLNVALNAEKLLRQCGEKLKQAGGEIWDETEFIRADVEASQVTVQVKHLPTGEGRSVSGRLLVDAMGTASPIAWQLNGGRAFDSVCPTVGAVIDGGFEPGVWDSQYGDVLNSHGDVSKGRQLIWELFPGEGNELTFYLFHYHQVHPENPGSLLEMYEDFFTILPEYRRCDMEKLVWKKPTFGYIPGHFSVNGNDRRVAFDRLIAIGDAASLQSPLVFTGFGSLVRNLPRLTDLLNTALKHDLLSAQHLEQIRAYQSNVSVTWLFSKGMMVPTGQHVQPQIINSMLNTFFGVLAAEPLSVAEAFIKDRADWLSFNRMAIRAAWQNPALLLWILQLAGAQDLLRWLSSYAEFTRQAIVNGLLGSWFPGFVHQVQPWVEPRYPALWLWLLAQRYALTYGMGQHQQMSKPQLGYLESTRLGFEAEESIANPNNNASDRKSTEPYTPPS
jgi:lycopene cyclase CruA